MKPGFQKEVTTRERGVGDRAAGGHVMSRAQRRGTDAVRTGLGGVGAGGGHGYQ